MNNLINKLKTDLGLNNIEQQNKNLYLADTDAKKIVHVMTALKNYYDFSHLVLITAVDWLENNKFQLSYIVHNRKENIDLCIRVYIDRDKAVMDSVHFLWPAVKTYQRELKEMFGIDFPFSPGVNDEFILEGWDYENNLPPYRRDFDTKKYSEETYFERPGRETYDPAEYMKEKLYKDFPKRTIGSNK